MLLSEFTVKHGAFDPVHGVLVTTVAPNVTWSAPMKPLPAMVSAVPPATGPAVGLSDVTAGTGAVNVWVLFEPLVGLCPPGVVTLTCTGPLTCDGVHTVIAVDEVTVKQGALSGG